MDPTTYQFIALDLPPLLAALFSAIACAILGSYLVLRRQSLLGDAISHSVLPGIVVAFLVTGSRSTIPIFVGAAFAGICSAFLIEIVRKFGNVDESAAMGVIFSTFFALGILTMEQAAARNIDLDPDCLLHGQLETIFWYPPNDWAAFFSWSTLASVPAEVYASAIAALLVIGFVTALWKELLISSFDPALCHALGFRSDLIHHTLMVLLACAVVASFKTVGSILVIALLVCPAATARLCTDRLGVHLILSVVFACVACSAGYVFAAFGPQWLGYEQSVNVAGMIAVISGVLLGGAACFAPRYGIVARRRSGRR
jgi:manganese/zinc/iron transport system permease protein